MDPITTAIVAALANLSKDAIKDGYVALKGALKKKFGETSDLVDAVDKLEKKPDSEARKAAVQEKVESAKVNDDPDIVKLVQELQKQVQLQDSAAGKTNVVFEDEVKGAQVGDHNTQTNTFEQRTGVSK